MYYNFISDCLDVLFLCGVAIWIELSLNKKYSHYIEGILFGLTTIFFMKNHTTIATGRFFDLQHIAMTMAGFIGGPVTGVIAAVIASLYRYKVGGTGLMGGILIINIFACFGSVLGKYLRGQENKKSPLFWFLIGVVMVCILLLIVDFIIPLSSGITPVSGTNSGLFLIITPLAMTMILSFYFWIYNIFSKALILDTILKECPINLIIFNENGPILVSKNLKSQPQSSQYIDNIFPVEDIRLEMLHETKNLHREVAREDGRHFVADFSSFRMPSTEYACVAIVNDITEMKGFITEREAELNKNIALETELSESNQLVADIIKNMTDAFYVLDSQWRFVFVNDRAEGILQRTQEELLGKVVWELFPTTKGSYAKQCFQKAKHDCVSITFETLSFAQKETWFQVTVYPTELGVSVYYRDITKHKLLQEKFTKTQEEMVAVLENMADGFCTIDRDWKFTYINRSGEMALKESRDVLLGKNMTEVFTLNETARYYYNEVMNKKKSVNFEIISEIFGNKWHGISAYPTNNGIAIYFRDITRRKLAEETLRQSEEKFAKAFHGGPIMMVLATVEDGKLIDANEAFCSATGYTREELIGHTTNELNFFVDTVERQERGKRIMEQGKIENAELDFRTKSGEIRNGHSWSQLFYLNEKPCHITGLIDVTQQKRARLERLALEGKIVTLKEEAEKEKRLNAAKSQFLANMSHEIRTPMSGIIGYIELLSTMPLEREQASYLAEIKASTDALLLLINDILDYSKIEAGKLLIETLPFNFHRLIEESVFLFAPKAHGKGIEIVSYIETRVPIEVQGDPGRLRQVLNNIIGNAVKFTDKGEVAVKVRVLKESKEKVLLQIEIQDTGIGISDETKQQLFQIFMQADASTTRKYEGTGLGLAISKKILEVLDGTIEVVSELDKGSTFIITLELEKGQLGDEEQKIRPPKSTNLNGLKVMIVDDNASNRIIFSEYLGETGCKVISANDGIEGFEILKGLTSESLPQIVLVDYMMPGMSGLEFGEQVLKDKRLKNIRLILVSSAAQKGDVRAAKEFGFSGYLSKPVRKKELIDVISGIDFQEIPGTIGNLVTGHLIPTISILLVEDMLANQRLEMVMLRKLGYSVELAINGKQAVEICNTKKYDLILMDCQMPMMDGYEATDQIRKESEFNKNTAIIAMTAHAMEGDREKCIEAGMDDYISKPITMAIIEDTIGKYLK